MTSTLPPLIQAVSGAIGSAAANSASYPLDLACTRLQLADESRKRSIFDELARIIRTHGIFGLYEGLETDTAATLVSNFFYFYTYAAIRSLLNRRKPVLASRAASAVLTAAEEIGAGFLAGVASRAVSTPLGLITVHLQEELRDEDASGRQESIKRVIRSIYVERGLQGFWRGFQTTALLCLNPSLTFFFFQAYRKLLLRGRHRANPSPWEAFIGAALSNVVAVTLLYPLILAKTRLQSAKTKGPAPPTSIFDIWKDALERSGFRSLYQGLVAQLFKGFLNQGLVLMTKQRIEQLIIGFYLYHTQKTSNKSPLVFLARSFSVLDDYNSPILTWLTMRIRALSESDTQL